VDGFLQSLLNPAVLVFLIPLAGIAIGGLSMWLKHQERMEKIRQGIDPDARRD
jgi:hypothetical protein